MLATLLHILIKHVLLLGFALAKKIRVTITDETFFWICLIAIKVHDRLIKCIYDVTIILLLL